MGKDKRVSCNYQLLILLIFLMGEVVFTASAQAQQAHIYEREKQIKTYPFSDPDPVPILTDKQGVYPYFRFDGYSTQAKMKKWNVVYLENPYIKVSVLPEVGGKVYGAIEKSTGNEFIYKNEVLKFRDIALRGPWTSGGIEFNFGVQGHTPTTATSVDYVLKENEDGSVSCFIGALDLASRTRWRVEIRLPKNSASFQTRSFWYNSTPLHQSYYYWSNAAIHTGDDLAYYFPGTNYVGHGGGLHSWPGTKYYRNTPRDGGSYHVLGTYGNYYGAYWHNRNFGFVHWSRYNETPGKKIFTWGLSRSGAIWEDLLTDNDGQYTEVQAGRLFSQAGLSSGLSSPFNQHLFSPQAADRWKEYWFPIKGIGGIDAAAPYAVMNIEQDSSSLVARINAIKPIQDTLTIVSKSETIHSEVVRLQPMDVFKTEITTASGQKDYTVKLGDNLVVSTQSKSRKDLQRPFQSKQEYPSSTAIRLFQRGEEQFAHRHYDKALRLYLKSLEKNPNNRQVLTRLAEIYNRKGKYEVALKYARRVIASDAYDAGGNLIYGIINRRMGRLVQAKEAFGWAARSMKYRSVGWQQMAEIYMLERKWDEAVHYAQKALNFNAFNMDAKKVLITAFRKKNNEEKACKVANGMLEINPLTHYAYFEKYLMNPTDENRKSFTSLIRNELPHETYLELAMDYYKMGLQEEAKKVLQFASSYPIANYWLAYLNRNDMQKSREYLNRALDDSAKLVFPFRHETIPVLNWALNQEDHWKTSYYLGLIMWSKGREEEARELMIRSRNQSDFAPFYLTRSYLLEQESPKKAENDIQHALELAPDQWRSYRRLTEWYVTNNEYEEAEDIAQKASKKFPQNYYVGLQYANVLLKNDDYKQSLNVLDDLRVLPSEGARYAHNIFVDAHIKLAMRNMKQKRYDEALQHIKASKTWPEHLGVGKPHNPDNRVQNYLAANIYQINNNSERADSLYQDILAYSKGKEIRTFNFANLVSLLVFEYYKKEQVARDIQNNFIQNWGRQDVVKSWLKARKNDSNIHALEQKLLQRSNSMPEWFRSFLQLKRQL